MVAGGAFFNSLLFFRVVQTYVAVCVRRRWCIMVGFRGPIANLEPILAIRTGLIKAPESVAAQLVPKWAYVFILPNIGVSVTYNADVSAPWTVDLPAFCRHHW